MQKGGVLADIWYVIMGYLVIFKGSTSSLYSISAVGPQKMLIQGRKKQYIRLWPYHFFCFFLFLGRV